MARNDMVASPNTGLSGAHPLLGVQAISQPFTSQRWRSRSALASAAGWILLASSICVAQDAPKPGDNAISKVQRDVLYDASQGRDLKLDFYSPRHILNQEDGGKIGPQAESGPILIVWVHGGAWRRGSKDSVPIKPMLELGYAIASVDYRLSETAKFPAQALDIKRAIHFLHDRPERFAFDRGRIVIAGASAGGHLAALVGVSHRAEQLEPFTRQPIRLAGIVSFYGASNLQSILSQTANVEKREFRTEALRLLLGGEPQNVPNLARLASPVAHLSADDPPITLLHGDADIQMPMAQSMELDAAYREEKLESRLQIIAGGGHGGEAFYTPRVLSQIDADIRAMPPAR